MNLYCFQLYDYESASDWLFIHKKAKTQEEWMSDVQNAIRECGEECISNARQSEEWIHNSDMIYAAFSVLEDRYGYVRVKPITYSIREGGIIGLHGDETEFSKIIGTALYQKAADWNRKYDKMSDELF